MRKVHQHIDTVKERIAALKGSHVRMSINKGRKKIIVLSGWVLEIYPSVFTVRIEGSKSLDVQSYSFSDVLTGDVKVKAVAAAAAEPAKAQALPG